MARALRRGGWSGPQPADPLPFCPPPTGGIFSPGARAQCRRTSRKRPRAPQWLLGPRGRAAVRAHGSRERQPFLGFSKGQDPSSGPGFQGARHSTARRRERAKPVGTGQRPQDIGRCCPKKVGRTQASKNQRFTPPSKTPEGLHELLSLHRTCRADGRHRLSALSSA